MTVYVLWNMCSLGCQPFSNLLKIHFSETHHFFIILNLKILIVVVQKNICRSFCLRTICLYYILMFPIINKQKMQMSIILKQAYILSFEKNVFIKST